MATMMVGSRGPEVRSLQARLAQAGFSPGPIDGAFGPKTQQAVERYQASQGLSVDGRVGPKTLATFQGSQFDLPPVTSTGARPASSEALSELGPYRVIKKTITLPLPGGRSTPADVYMPQGPGPFPAVIHAYGLMQNQARYAGTAQHYSSWGLITIVPKLPHGSGAPGENAKELKHVVDWVMTRPASLGATLDTRRGVGLSGHSFGGLTALLAASNQANVGAVVAHDPADLNKQGYAAGPGIQAPAAFVIGRPELVNQFGNGFRIFDRASSSQKDLFTISGAHHMDFQNSSVEGPKNKPNAVSMRFATAFLLRHLAGKQEYSVYQGHGAEVARAQRLGELGTVR